MSPRHGASSAPEHVELVGFEEAASGPASPDDGLDLGASPRAPMTPRTRRRLAAAAAVLVVAGGAVFVAVRPDEPPARPAAAASSPAVESSAGFAAGPVLVTVGGRDALQAPGLPGLGASTDPVVLDPAPDEIAVVSAALPGFRDVRGGRVPADVGGENGVYLAGQYDGTDGSPVSVTLYSVRAPGTTYGTDQFVSRTRFDATYNIRTDVSVFTGTGWWVHVVSLAPDDGGAHSSGDVDRLLPLARDPRLVAS